MPKQELKPGDLSKCQVCGGVLVYLDRWYHDDKDLADHDPEPGEVEK